MIFDVLRVPAALRETGFSSGDHLFQRGEPYDARPGQCRASTANRPLLIATAIFIRIESPLTAVIKFANMTDMKYTIEYFHARVKNEIEGWPDGILAELRLARRRMKEIRNG